MLKPDGSFIGLPAVGVKCTWCDRWATQRRSEMRDGHFVTYPVCDGHWIDAGGGVGG